MSVWMVPVLGALGAASALVALCAKAVAELAGGLPGGHEAVAGASEAVALWCLAAAVALAVAAAAAVRRRWSRWVYPVAWGPLGFSPLEARRWARWRFRPEEALEQRAQGRTPPEAAVASRLLQGSAIGAFLAAASEVPPTRAGEEDRS